MHCNMLEKAVKIAFSNGTTGAPTCPTAGALDIRHCWKIYCRRSATCADGTHQLPVKQARRAGSN